MTMYFPVDLQTLHDVGLNPFAVKLLAESYAQHPTPRHVAFTYETERAGRPVKIWIRMDPREPAVEDDVDRLRRLLEEARKRMLAAAKSHGEAQVELDTLRTRLDDLREHIGSFQDDCPASLIAWSHAYCEGARRALRIMLGEE